MRKNKDTNLIKNGYLEAREVTAKYAKTFYFASKFLPPEERFSAYAVYALCRLSDMAVDETPEAQKVNRLQGIKKSVREVYAGTPLSDPLLLAFRDSVNKHGIPEEYFTQLFEGMQMDLTISRYPDFGHLETYCYRAAGVIGLIMLKIFDSRKAAAEKYAADLGIAMQLTNIVRDIKEDFERGRIYLPLDELESFKVKEGDIAKGLVNENFKKLLKFQIERARNYYSRIYPGLEYIENRRLRIVILIMQRAYAGILDSIEKNGYDVFNRRAGTGSGKKIIEAVKAIINAKPALKLRPKTF